jgi:hypothetical protein
MAPFNDPTEPMMKGLDVGSLSGRPRPGIALEPELAGVIWAKPYEAARIARSHVIAYTTRFPDGVVNGGQKPYRMRRREKSWHGTCVRFSRSMASNAWWQTKAG